MPSNTDNIHESHRARVRKAYIERGELKGMHEHEMLELLLFYAIKRRDVNPLAHRLIDRFGSLKGVLGASVNELCAAGLSENTAVLLKLVGDIGKELDRKQASTTTINNTNDAMNACHRLLFRERNEVFAVFCLDAKKRVIKVFTQSSGMPGRVSALPKWIVDCAISSAATAVLLAHNHPSGEITPSSRDIETTAMIERLLDSLGIAMLDHIIVSVEKSYSMKRDYALEACEEDGEAETEENDVAG